MPLLRRKPVLLTPLPSLSTIVQPLHGAGTTAGGSSPAPGPAAADDFPQDGKDDEEQLDKLLAALSNPGPSKRGHKANGASNGSAAAAMPPPPLVGNGIPGYRVKNVEVFYIAETGEMFLDYESYAARRAFYEQPLFQCEVSGKSALTYFDALESESEQVRMLHSRFPRQLKKAVLASVQFQVEGKLETLADKVFERFHNRFFDDEKVFVDVQGDKYLARVVRTFPPKNLVQPAGQAVLAYHPYATDLNMTNEDVVEHDDPMKYFYQVRLIEEGGEGIATEYASTNSNSADADEEDGKWQQSVMEVQADKISRDRINFSRAILKRFIRDCVSREAAICSPWLVKKAVAKRYGIPTEISDELLQTIALRRNKQMEKRKRDREPAKAVGQSELEETEDDAHPGKKKRRTKAEREKEKEDKEKEKARLKVELELQKLKEKEEKEKEEEEKKKKRGIKYPCEDLILEFSPERDGAAGRIEVRPTPNRHLPFGEQFETFLMAWSFLNVMGNALGLSPFSIDDFEQALYHTDPYTAPVSLLVEIHAALLNTLVRDLQAGNEPVRPLALTGVDTENDTDDWEGNKGATTETLRPVAMPLAESWKRRELSPRDNRRGWENALVGCLWERATLETFPSYLDSILYLTFENKPAPTRPTWSTGPSSNSTHGLIQTKPDKRYTSLHFVHKLNIIAFLIELVAQTAAIRDLMEEASADLTEVRKDQIEVRREWRKVRAERDALEKDKEPDGDGDTTMDGVKDEPTDSRAVSPNGHANGNGTATNTDRDELEGSMAGDHRSRASSPGSDGGRVYTGAQRRRAMKEKAAEREAEEAMRAARLAKEREEERQRKNEAKIVAAEKRRLEEEEEALDARLRQLEFDFRRHFYTLRARPLGSDRFGNKVWWMDGLGSAPLYANGKVGEGKIQWGTGRLYLQGADDLDVEFARAPVDMSIVDINARRDREEGPGRLEPGQWAMYDTIEQLEAFQNWLNPRGTREAHLLRAFKLWWPELEGGFRRRRLAAGLDQPPEEENTRRTRPRRTAGEEENAGYLGWKNRKA